MAADDVSNDVTDLIEQQHSFKPYKDVITYLKGKSCSLPKNTGLDINRFIINEELLCISSANAYGKVFNRICIPPGLIKDTLAKAHIATGHGGVKRM